MPKIVSVEPVEDQFLVDIEVENSHTYRLQNNAITHNTVSLLGGATPGVHFPISQFYIRRVRITNNHKLVNWAKECGYHVEPCIGSEKTTSVISFPIQSENGVRYDNSVSMWEKLEIVRILQAYWSDNQVSVTVNFTEAEAKDIKYALDYSADQVKSLSFLPMSNHVFPQLPYEPITEEVYNTMMSKIKVINVRDKRRYSEMESEEDFGCDGDKCVISK